MMSSQCSHLNLKGVQCVNLSKVNGKCKRHIKSLESEKCISADCNRRTRSGIGLCSKCMEDEKHIKMVLTKSIDMEKRNKIIEIKNLLVRYSIVHTIPVFSSRAMYELFNKIKEFNDLYGIQLDGDDLTDYSDTGSISSCASSAFTLSSHLEDGGDTDIEEN